MIRNHGNEQDIAALQGDTACRGKVPHPSKRHALAAGRATLAHPQRHRPGLVLNAYRCRRCGKWHLGNSPARFVESSHRVQASDAPPLERELAAVLQPYL